MANNSLSYLEAAIRDQAPGRPTPVAADSYLQQAIGSPAPVSATFDGGGVFGSRDEYDAWIAKNERLARVLASKVAPSRADMDAVGLTRGTAKERKEFAAWMNKQLGEGKQASTLGPDLKLKINPVLQDLPRLSISDPNSGAKKFAEVSRRLMEDPAKPGFWQDLVKAWREGDTGAALDEIDFQAVRGAIDPEKADRARREAPAATAGKGRGWWWNAAVGAVKTLPHILRGKAEGATYGLAFAGTAAVAGQAGPQVLAPEELVTVPAAGAAGMMVGSASYWFRQGTGSIYRAMRDSGVTHETAAQLAPFAGLPYALIEYSQVDKIIPGIGREAKNLAKMTYMKALTRLGALVGLNTAKEVGEEVLQKGVEETTRVVGLFLEDKIDKSNVSAELKQSGKAMIAEGMAAIGPMLILQIPGAGAGGINAVTEARRQKGVAAEIQRNIERQRLRETLDSIDQKVQPPQPSPKPQPQAEDKSDPGAQPPPAPDQAARPPAGPTEGVQPSPQPKTKAQAIEAYKQAYDLIVEADSDIKLDPAKFGLTKEEATAAEIEVEARGDTDLGPDNEGQDIAPRQNEDGTAHPREALVAAISNLNAIEKTGNPSGGFSDRQGVADNIRSVLKEFSPTQAADIDRLTEGELIGIAQQEYDQRQKLLERYRERKQRRADATAEAEAEKQAEIEEQQRIEAEKKAKTEAIAAEKAKVAEAQQKLKDTNTQLVGSTFDANTQYATATEDDTGPTEPRGDVTDVEYVKKVVSLKGPAEKPGGLSVIVGRRRATDTELAALEASRKAAATDTADKLGEMSDTDFDAMMGELSGKVDKPAELPPDPEAEKIGKGDTVKVRAPKDHAAFSAEARNIIRSTDKTIAKNAAMRRLAEQNGLDEKDAQELVESELVEVAREIARDTGRSEQERFDALVQLYENQPLFSKQTSDSKIRQQFSTPAPIAFAADIMAGVTDTTTLYEPTAGMSMLTLTGDKGNIHVNEIDDLRAAELRRKGFKIVTAKDATGFKPVNKFDRVVTNPPFGSVDPAVKVDGYILKKLDHLIAARALGAMKDDGAATLILGANLKAGEIGVSDRVFLNWLMNNYNLAGHFEIDGSLYSRQGASFPIRVIVVAGRKPSTGFQDVAPTEAVRVGSWNELWDKVQEVRNEAERIRSSMDSGKSGSLDGRTERGEGGKPGTGTNLAAEDAGTAGGGGKPGGTEAGKSGTRGMGDRRGNGDSERGLDGSGPAEGVDSKRSPGRKRPDAAEKGAGGVGRPGGNQGQDGRGIGPDGKPDATGLDSKSLVEAKARQLTDAAKAQGVTGIDGAAAGLADLFGFPEDDRSLEDLESSGFIMGAPSGSGVEVAAVPEFDPAKYAKAKPHLEKAFAEFSRAGKDIRAFAQWALGQFGDSIIPYLKQFKNDLAAKPKPKTRVVEGKSISEHLRAYNGASSGPPMGTVINKGISHGVVKALNKLLAKYGDIDAWLADQLGYDSVSAMHAGLGQEQIDTVAMAIDNIQEGSALIIGHQPGVGKGRCGCGIMRYAQKNGYTPVFFTADPKLFSDIYADMQDIGGSMKPLIIGESTKASIRNSDDDIVVQAPSKEAQDALMAAEEDGKSIRAHGYDAVLMPYSQLSGIDAKDSDYNNKRQRFLRALANNGPVLIVMDESHLASGKESTTGTFFRGGVIRKKISGVNTDITFDGILNHSNVKGVAYMSGSWSKRPDTMGVYFKTSLGKAAQTYQQLMDAFEKGGVAIQQWAANGLAEGGELVRSERDFGQIRIESKRIGLDDPVRTSKEIKRIDNITEVLRELVEFSRLVNGVLENATTDQDSSLKRNDFAAIVHNYIQQVTLAAKVDAVVEEAIASHKKGEKTVIVLSNTMGSFLKDFAEQNDLHDGDVINISFNDVLKRALDRTMRESVPMVGGGRQVVQHTAAELGLQEEYAAIVDMIKELPDDVPFSPIDHIHKRLLDAGIRSGEITGRTQYIDYASGKPVYRTRRDASLRDKNKVVNAFNRNQLDSLTINQSGSTGLSVHASEKFQDKRPRHMIIAQGSLNIDTFMQTLFRILRTGMAGKASDLAHYTMLALPIEAERRPQAVLSKKMKSQNANTTGDQSSDFDKLAFEFMNKYGDKVVSELLHEDPSLAADVHIDTEIDHETGEVIVIKDVARKVTGRIAVLPNERQSQVYEEILRRYDEYVAELKEAGTYDLEIDIQEKWDARLLTSKEIEKGADNSSPFTSDILLNKYSIVDPRPAPTPADLKKAITDRWGPVSLKPKPNTKGVWHIRHGEPGSYPEHVRAGLKKALAEYMAKLQGMEAKYLGEKPQSMDPVLVAEGKISKEEAAANAALRQAYKQRQDRLEQGRLAVSQVIETLNDAAGLSLDIENTIAAETIPGLLTDVTLTVPTAGNPYRIANIRVQTWVESRRRTMTFPASRLQNGTIKLMDRGYDFDIEAFGENLVQTDRVEKYVFEGNLIGALNAIGSARGLVTTFRRSDGSVVTGLAMPASFTGDVANDPRLIVKNGEDGVAKMEEHGVMVHGPYITFRRRWNSFDISTDKSTRKGGVYYKDPKLVKITGGFSSYGQQMRTESITRKQMVEAIDYVITNMGQQLTFMGDTSALTPDNTKTVDQDTGELAPGDDTAGSPRTIAPGGSYQGRGMGPDRPGPIGADHILQAADVIAEARRMWPEVQIRGKATFRIKNPGWYHILEAVVRLKDVRALDVLMHELGHHFDREMGMWTKKPGLPRGVASELAQLGHDIYGSERPAAGYRPEGWAEFIRAYVFGEDIQTRAPTLYDWFLTDYLVNNPEQGRKLEKLTRMLEILHNQSPGEVVRAFSSPIKKRFNTRETIARIIRSAGADLINHINVLANSIKDAGIVPDEINLLRNPVEVATYFTGSGPFMAQSLLLEQTHDLFGNRTGDGLSHVLRKVKTHGEAGRLLADYLVAKRAQFENNKGIQSGLSPRVADATVAKLETPEYLEVVRGIREWSSRCLDLLVESGVMTKEAKDKIIAENEIYVPFARQFYDEEIRFLSEGGSRKKVVFKIHGNGREINNIWDSFVAQTERIVEAAATGYLLRSIVDVQREALKTREKALGNYLVQVPAPLEGVTFKADKIKKFVGRKAVEMGADPDVVIAKMLEDWNEPITIFKLAKHYTGKDWIFPVRIDGQTMWFEAQPDLYKFLNYMTVSHSREGFGGQLLAIMRLATKAKRFGATGGNPDWMLTNLGRDAQTAAIQSDYSNAGPFISLFGAFLRFTRPDLVARYRAQGIPLAQFDGQDRGSMKHMRRQVLAKNQMERFLVSMFMQPLDLFQAIIGDPEMYPRLYEFHLALQDANKKGMDPKSAGIRAGNAAKDLTTNFSSRGRFTSHVGPYIAYLTANINSAEKFIRTATRHPWRTMARGALWITFMAMSQYFRNRDEEWWQKLPPHLKWGWIHFGGKLKAPLPFAPGVLFGSLIPAAIEESRGNKGAVMEVLNLMRQQMQPPMTPDAFSGIITALRNKDWRGVPIVGEWLSRSRVPEDQYSDYTTEFAVAVSKQWGGVISPAMLDEIVNVYAGGAWKRAAKYIRMGLDPSSMTADKDLSGLPLVGNYFLRKESSNIPNEFYDRQAQLQRQYGSNKITLEEIGEWRSGGKVEKQLTALRDVRVEATRSGRAATGMPIANEMRRQADKLIQAHAATDPDTFRDLGIASLLIEATDPDATNEDLARAQKLLSMYPQEELEGRLSSAVKARGGNTAVVSSTLKATSYGLRLRKLRELRARWDRGQ